MCENTKWYNILIVGIPLAIITYFTFSWAIKKFNIPTQAEEDDVVYNALLQEKNVIK